MTDEEFKEIYGEEAVRVSAGLTDDVLSPSKEGGI